MLRADDGVALWYQRVGEGPPVVFCHGGPGIADYLEPVQQIVADMVTVYRWDQRGSGRSDPAGPFTIARFVADLEALRTHVGHDQWTLLGHSWGANLAIHYAQAHPARIRGIVYLCGTGLEWPRHKPAHKQEQRCRLTATELARFDELGARPRTEDEEREYRLLYIGTDFGSSRAADEHAESVLDTFTRLPQAPQANADLNVEAAALRAEEQIATCGKINAPVLVVACDAGPRPNAGTNTLVAALPNVTRVTIHGSGHLPWLEAPDALRRLLRLHLPELTHPR